MELIAKQLSVCVGKAFAQCGFDEKLGTVTASDRLDLCQYQCNGAFAGAKLYRKAPFVIAQQVCEVLQGGDIFEKAEAVKPGFINLTLRDGYLVALCNGIAGDEQLGVPQAPGKPTVVVDYGGPNVAKPLHIGHLRPAIIGESLKRLMRKCGCRVIGDVHLGDWGLPMGLVIAELELRNPDWKCFAPDYRTGDALPEICVDELNEIYPFASKKSKEDPAFSARAHEITALLQSRRPCYYDLWKKILAASVEDMKKSYNRLNVEFDLWYGESDADPFVGKTLQLFENKGLLRESDGAKVVDVALPEDKAPMPPSILVKSDGAVNYDTTDIATIMQRVEEFDPDMIWYCVDNRQSLHFTQIFRAARKAGMVGENVLLEHLGNGTMNGSDGRPFKTRDGGVMRLSDLLDTVADAAYAKMTASGYVSEEDRRHTAQKVGIAAIKFGDLINQRTKDYVFDMDKFLSFEGKTGTYILYTVTRINSILKKAEQSGEGEIAGVYSDSDRELLLKILETPAAFQMAVEERAPNYIAENAYQLAVSFSRFYHNNRIVDEADAQKRASWLALCRLTRELICLHLDVLGIEPVENM